MKKPLILIAGPTASGKTSTSVLLAQTINGEIISSDSMQVYRGMDIGTAKVKKEEMQNIKHYMIDVLSPSESCNVAWFKDQVYSCIDEIHKKGKTPILVGGTGFYLNAILHDTKFEEAKEDLEYRKQLEEQAKTEGVLSLFEKLEKIDPSSAKTIHPNNVKRVIRALEYYHQTKTPISEHNTIEKAKKEQLQSPYDATFFALEMDRAVLYERINKRIDIMMDEGLLKEVKSFYDAGFTGNEPSMKAIGYKEFFPYFKGEQTLDECIEKLKQSTRQYAKRQMTWLRHQANPHFIQVDNMNFDTEVIVKQILRIIENKAFEV
ncbi:MAG: tRNA (adenosine(37)-N6)-dimethylallyltransferase MiaA [Cellulosilyticaceae bacterium]